MKGSFSIVFFLAFAAHLRSAEFPSIVVDFDRIESGELSVAEVEERFGPLSWESLGGRAAVVPVEAGKVMEVTYPEGSAASKDSGAQFVVEYSPSRYATLSYRFRPAEGFPFVKGGKLPGLASGGSRFTGGRPPGEQGGWSARYMWRREGELELYFYHPAMESDYGEGHPLDTRLEPGEWVEIIQRIDTGVKGQRDGRIEVEIDGVVKLVLDGLELHGSRYGPVDTFLFSTFYGGSSADWAPPEETTIQFDDFHLSPEKPAFSGN